jgi:hypothetical protein
MFHVEHRRIAKEQVAGIRFGFSPWGKMSIRKGIVIPSEVEGSGSLDATLPKRSTWNIVNNMIDSDESPLFCDQPALSQPRISTATPNFSRHQPSLNLTPNLFPIKRLPSLENRSKIVLHNFASLLHSRSRLPSPPPPDSLLSHG